MKNSYFAFDDTLGDVDEHSIGVIGDYLIYQNRDAIITMNCWQEIAKKYSGKKEAFELLRGLFEDNLAEHKDKTPEQSVILHLNYTSQFKPIILVTNKKYTQTGSGANVLKSSLRIYTFSHVVEYIENDEDFNVYMMRLKNLLLIQKMDSKCKVDLLKNLDSRSN